jgi:hypothetical protein
MIQDVHDRQRKRHQTVIQDQMILVVRDLQLSDRFKLGQQLRLHQTAIRDQVTQDVQDQQHKHRQTVIQDRQILVAQDPQLKDQLPPGQQLRRRQTAIQDQVIQDVHDQQLRDLLDQQKENQPHTCLQSVHP